jgi:hypothetical protein
VEQLLGNLVLMSVRLERLGYRREDLRRLDRLELKGGRALLGPHLWFRLLTTSVAEQTAKLLLEFNRYCVPLAERGRARVEDLEAMRRWLDRLWGRGPGAIRREVDRERRRYEHFRTTAFHALHFLSDEPSRDAEVAEEFGEEIRDALAYARRTMIRRIFASHPLHALPRDARSLNLYGFYRRRLSGGRVLLLPLTLALGVLGWIPRLVRLVASAVRDILDPRFLPESVGADASLPAARRKIDRMRRPILLESMRLRAEFDPEYLGLALPGLSRPQRGFGTIQIDLDFIQASGAERQLVDTLCRQRKEAASRLEDTLIRQGHLRRVGPELLSLAPHLTPEGLRAMCLAWLIDYRGVARLVEAEARIDEILDRLASDAADLDRGHLARLGAGLGRLWRRRLFLRPDPLETAYARYESARGWDTHPAPDRERRGRAYLLDLEGVRSRIDEILSRGLAGRAAEEAGRLLAQIGAHPETWSTQLLTVRAVQCLAILDLLHLRETVEALGRYRGDPTARSRAAGSFADSAPVLKNVRPAEVHG